MDDLYEHFDKSQSIRIAKISDCPAIAAIYNQYVGKSTMDLSPLSAEYYEHWLETKSDREEIVIFEQVDTVVGWGILKKYSEREGYARAAETSVYIDKAYLNQGIGSRLKKQLIAMAKKRKYGHLVAKIWASNQISIDYNLKLGYEMVGIQKKIGYVDNQWIDVAILQLVLTE